MTDPTPPTTDTSPGGIPAWVYGLVLVVVLLGGAFLRFSGIFWGEYQYLHPDERFLVWVGSDISPVKTLGEYFNTPVSSLNPHNVGHGFYVYGTLPMFITRYAVEWVFGHSGFDVMTQVGRVLSAALDLLAIALVYLAASRLYDRRVGLLAAAFSAAAVLQIQQSHFFTMDTFLNAFMLLAFYFAVRAATVDPQRVISPILTQTGEVPPDEKSRPVQAGDLENRFRERLKGFVRNPLFLPSLGFGLALGMAASSKLDAAPVAVVLPAAVLLASTRLPARKRFDFNLQAALYVILAAAVSLIVFRLLQPYAFSGPGILGVKPNPQWMGNIRELLAQSQGDVDFPPAMQWARRPRWFSFQNLVLWGLGLPYGTLAWGGFLWAGWRTLKVWKKQPREWTSHGLIWGWTGAYFIWQSLRLNSTMRYQLPIYPLLAIFAAWAIVALYDRAKKASLPAGSADRLAKRWGRHAAIFLGGAVLLSTWAYAFAFSQIYTRPITRIEASRWIYQNIPGPINLQIETGDGTVNQPVPFPYSKTIAPGSPYSYTFRPRAAGALGEVLLPKVVDLKNDHQVRDLELTLYRAASPEEKLVSAKISADSSTREGQRGNSLAFIFEHPVTLDPESSYRLEIETPGQAPAVALDGALTLTIQPAEPAEAAQPFDLPIQAQGSVVRVDTPFSADFTASLDGYVTHLTFKGISSEQGDFDPQGLRITLQDAQQTDEPMTSEFSTAEALGEQAYRVVLEQPLPIAVAEDYLLSIELWPAGGIFSVSGFSVANEGEWDDGLPIRLDGLDGYSGIYPLDLNFNMYWDENPEKLERFTRILDQSDYIFISSSRQWGSLPRIPERFPMTTIYYRNLVGCPDTLEIEYCYNVAQPGTFEGKLGFELVKTFQSDIRLGPLRINDQFAEEAFTVYDHPKVFIFRKTSDYDPSRAEGILARADFSKIIRLPPMQYPSHPSDLLLPHPRWAEQQTGGSWSKLFDMDAWHNRYQALGAALWYLCVGLLGLVFYPLMRKAFPGLDDRGYPLARTAGMLALALLIWTAGSFRIPFTRPVISAAIGLLLLAGGFLAVRQRRELVAEFRSRGRYFLVVEGLALAFFLAFLLVRLGNPDLWHQWKGGEKPMDFSYFNAVLKSTSFPPYDPWYAGGFLNYYYYGFVFAGVLVKWLGIVPSFAYNLILPTIFSLIAMGAFSMAWNLASKDREGHGSASGNSDDEAFLDPTRMVAAVSAAFGMALLGNLGTVRMIFQGLQKLVAPEGIISGANLITRWLWALRGLLLTIQGSKLPISLGDWYWIPSRVIPAPGEVEPITEFPYFTVLYGDPHAHLFALPIALLALAGTVGIVLSRRLAKGWTGSLLAFLITAMAIGALKPTNTWDFYTYLALGICGAGYALWTHYREPARLKADYPLLAELPAQLLRSLWSAGGILLIAGLAVFLYQPFERWYALGYTRVELWKGTHTPLNAYLTHWGLFLFVILSWMGWETIDWMARTPISALRKLKSHRGFLQAAILGLILAILVLFWLKVGIGWFVLPLMVWTGVLIFKPGIPVTKRMALFMFGTGLALTLTVELIVLRGDIGRMNTVFKFYLQVWTLFAVCAAAGLGWLAEPMKRWSFSWRAVWQTGLAFLVAGAALYTLTATMAKVKDRMTGNAPHTLDGMTYMAYSTYREEWGDMDLNQDYQAIRWLQENVSGSPVIVEANLRDLYRWGSRYTIYTGLPGVVGWEWHQQQQRTVVPGNWVSSRIDEVADFYLTTDWQAAQDFLMRYNVRYIILGQQERGKYPGEGLDKFQEAEGLLWKVIYRVGETIIYEVLIDMED